MNFIHGFYYIYWYLVNGLYYNINTFNFGCMIGLLSLPFVAIFSLVGVVRMFE